MSCPPCQACGKPGHKLCSRCGVARYCSVDCQRADWPAHKAACNPKSHASPQDLDRVRKNALRVVADRESYEFRHRQLPRNQAEFDRRLAKCEALEGRAENSAIRERLFAHIRRSWAGKIDSLRRDMPMPSVVGEVYQYYVFSRLTPAAYPSKLHDQGGVYAHIFFCRCAHTPWALYCKILGGSRRLLSDDDHFLSFFLRRDDIIDGEGDRNGVSPLLCKFDPREPDETVDWDTGEARPGGS